MTDRPWIRRILIDRQTDRQTDHYHHDYVMYSIFLQPTGAYSQYLVSMNGMPRSVARASPSAVLTCRWCCGRSILLPTSNASKCSPPSCFARSNQCLTWSKESRLYIHHNWYQMDQKPIIDIISTLMSISRSGKYRAMWCLVCSTCSTVRTLPRYIVY